MIRITAKINIGENGGELNTVASPTAGITGSSTLNEVIGKHEQIQRPFILGRSRLGGGECFTKKANFYIGSIASDSDGNFSSNYGITVSGGNITLLTIIFNKQKNEFPRSILVDGEAFYDDDSTWTIPLDGADTHTITISNWNKSGSPLVISSIYTDLSIDLNETNLLDFERTIMDRSDVSMPSFGIISNTGKLSFIDGDGEVADYIAQQIVSSENIISAYLENTETGAKEQIAYFNTAKWSYNNSQSLVNVELKDDLEEWQDIKVSGIDYKQQISMNEVYTYLRSVTPSKYVFDDTDEETLLSYLQSIVSRYVHLDDGSLWSEWHKLCQIAMLRIFKGGDGKIKIRRGVV